MSSSDFSGVLNILRSLYPFTESLEEFLEGVVFKEGRKAVLIEPSDTNVFKGFVRNVVVCYDKKLQQKPSLNQICTLRELLAFVLNNMKRKKRRNVLAHGYKFLSMAQQDRDADSFKLQGEVTLSAAYIHGSDLWKKVSSRLGTDITRYLLESCSLFVAVPPSCMFQVCGVPVYDRVSANSATSGFSLQSRFKKQHCAQVGRYRGSLTSKGRQSVDNPAKSKHNKRREFKLKKGKRKKGMDAMCPRKRRRLQENQQTGIETTEERHQPMSVDSIPSMVPMETDSPGFKQPVKIPSVTHPLDGGPSWRSGVFPALPPSQCFIRTLGILHGGRGMRGFLLNRKKKSGEVCSRLQGRDLVRIVFFEGLAYLNGMEKKPKRLPQRFFNMVPLFNQLLQQHRRCPYSHLLHRLCPIVEDNNASQSELNSLLPKHCAPHRVYLFIRECLSAVIPQEMWGSDHNRIRFFVRVKGFLQSGKFERLSLAELMWKIKVTDCDWLKISKTGRVPPSELAYRTQTLGQFFAWLLDGYVGGIVRAFFYVTESMGQKNALRFYRQEVWTRLQDLAFRGHLSKGQMKELTPAQVASLPKGTVFSRLRFIPKTDSMRPISRVLGADAKTRLYKANVQSLLDLLWVRVRSDPSLLGSTVWSMTDIHKVLASLVPAQKDNPQPLYFVKVDVSGAYESIPHDKLLEVIRQALSPVQDKPVTVRSYAKVWADSFEGLKKTFARKSDFLEDGRGSINMKTFLMSEQRSGKIHHAILVEQHFCSALQGKEALQFFTQMLAGSIVRYGKKTYRQCRGIPQGSVVSSLLCCLCYGHMENALFKNILENKGRLMRLVDDFLLITPNQQEAQAFLGILMAGVPEYGVVINPQKVVVNFQTATKAVMCPSIRVLPSHCLFPWCGLLLDTHSLDVYKDYSSLTLGSFHSAGQQMRRKLMAVFRLKAHALFLDLKTNSLEAVYKNMYKLVLLHAYRFHVCCQSLPFGQTVAKNTAYFLQMIWDMAQYANKIVRHSNKGVFLGSKAQTGIIQFEAVELIFCLSFLLVLSQHRHLYKDLLTHLHKRKRSLERRLGDLRLARVRQAATPRIPDDFRAVKM